MRFNILHHLFQAKVDSDVVSSEGYEVSNLVSSNFRERTKGFLAAHFIKAPVQILFQLPFAINVEKILLNPKVGSQVSCGFEVLVAGVKCQRHETVAAKFVTSCNMKRKSNTLHVSSKKQRTLSSKYGLKRGQNETGRDKDATVPSNLLPDNSASLMHSYECEITSLSAKTEHRNRFVSVAHAFTDAGAPFIIYNNRFFERQALKTQSVQMTENEAGMAVYSFRNMHALQCVTHFIIRIIRIRGSSVPALKNIEVWGQPAQNCPQEVITFAATIQKQITDENQTGFHDVKPETGLRKSNSAVPAINDLNSVDIPQDFIDPITCCVMTIPILLPSGHNIDSTTLEKHTECEKGWGRAASDPFTGVTFSDNYRPLPNSSLKVRIDRFLLTSQLDVRNFGRTVGRNKTTANADLSVVKKNGRKLLQPTYHAPKCYTNNGDHETGPKAVISDVKVETKPKCDDKFEENLGNKSRFCMDHESELSQSLNTALTKALQGLHSFTRVTQPVEPQSSKAKNLIQDSQKVNTAVSSLITEMPSQSESICKTTRTSNCSTLAALKNSSTTKNHACPGCKVNMQDQAVFGLPCGHVLCRTCLLALGNNKSLSCITCSKQFLKKDAVRLHTA